MNRTAVRLVLAQLGGTMLWADVNGDYVSVSIAIASQSAMLACGHSVGAGDVIGRMPSDTWRCLDCVILMLRSVSA